MQLKTIQAAAVKSVFEVLKDIINDVNVYFTAKGVHILTLDTARVTLVHMTLGAENFEEYECPADIAAGLNMGNIYKLLKSVTNQDTLTLKVEGRDVMEVLIENPVKKSATSFKLKLLDINEDILEVPDIHMNVVTTLPSVDFQRITRDMGNLANDMSIIREGTKLILSCRGDWADQETLLEFPDAVSKTGNIFSLKYINLFTKATNMCSSVQLMQDSENENMPIIFRYTIANLGDLRFYLAPKLDS
ncbi:putative proliferating cell nuclear antigen II [Yellowstone lake phycodnavirus 3]|jgi:proliferating cell nuclear antigen|uniref:putative proliferating cell nuclear antigen II n=1 Tax=Yellowstone lake phycodnavirus 3 TaxID=1586715 RepID=UPI0006EB5FB4|nr:putative proliferating cell nuclear antigen II [Yellowstone lake phycodnavirus 3]BAT22511.1 putative proliferating cell nuclear antigen II [Yellowstone lake phycodnavirus 3]